MEMKKIDFKSLFEVIFILSILIIGFILYLRSEKIEATPAPYHKFVPVPVIDTTGTYPEPDTLIDLGYGVTTRTYKETFE